MSRGPSRTTGRRGPAVGEQLTAFHGCRITESRVPLGPGLDRRRQGFTAPRCCPSISLRAQQPVKRWQMAEQSEAGGNTGFLASDHIIGQNINWGLTLTRGYSTMRRPSVSIGNKE
jgi:hypothetical protein